MRFKLPAPCTYVNTLFEMPMVINGADICCSGCIAMGVARIYQVIVVAYAGHCYNGG